MFSYGSGLASSFFSVNVVGSTQTMFETLKVKERLQDREEVSVQEFEKIMERRELRHNMKDYTPASSGDVEGTVYLKAVDNLFRREYNS